MHRTVRITCLEDYNGNANEHDDGWMTIHRGEWQKYSDTRWSPLGWLCLSLPRGNGKASSSRSNWPLTGCHTVTIKLALDWLVVICYCYFTNIILEVSCCCWRCCWNCHHYITLGGHPFPMCTRRGMRTRCRWTYADGGSSMWISTIKIRAHWRHPVFVSCKETDWCILYQILSFDGVKSGNFSSI